MNTLPKWVLANPIPAIHDFESLTVIDQTARIYGAMNQLIEEYNAFAEAANKHYESFSESEAEARKEFELQITKVMNEFRCSMERYLKLNLDDTATKVILEGMNNGSIPVPTDSTLKKPSLPAEAAATGAKIAEIAADLAAEIAYERERITNLSRLGEGSTTGDAELQEIRLAIDGNTYASAAEAVRAQAKRATPIVKIADSAHFNYSPSDRVLVVKRETGSITVCSVYDFGKVINFQIPTSTAFYTDANNETGVKYHIINTKTASGRSEYANTYIYTPGDYIMFASYATMLWPVSACAADLYIDGIPYHCSYGRETLYTLDRIVVDYGTKKIRIPSTFLVSLKNDCPSVEKYIASAITVDIADSDGGVMMVVYNDVTDALTIEDRSYSLLKNEHALFFYLSKNEMIPVEISPGCVNYVYDSPMSNNTYKTPSDIISQIATAKEPVKIVLGGDSITHGVGGSGFAQDGDLVLENTDNRWYRNTSGYCWAKLFKQYIERNYNATVTNNACTGTWSHTWNNHKETLIPADTDILILTIGTNNRNALYEYTTKEQLLDKYYNDLVSIVNYCNNNGTKVILCSPIPASAANENMDGRILHVWEINSVVQKVANDFNIGYVNMYNAIHFYMKDKGLSINDYLPDGLHPNDAMYEIMFYEYLKAMNLAPDYAE